MVRESNLVDISFLSSSIPEMWELLDNKGRAEISSTAKILEFKKNEVIYYEEETPKDLMCLLKGKVKIYKNGVGGRSQIIRMIRPVQHFGYRAYFANEPYVTAAAAFEASTICFIPMKVIEKLVTTNSKLALFFIKELATDLGIADERVVNLTQKHIRGRLAESLIFLMDNYGLEEDGATISIYLSREDLANLSNMTTSNAIRTLSNFVDEHIITLDGRKIKIIDDDQLRKISKIG
ncbi:Crp/Fnr family transcriptional regulator [Viscerimonas tarda]